MKNIFYILLLLPTIIFAQYPSNSGQKITLGEQTTADGLVYRGVASADTTRKPSIDTMAFILLDTTTNILWQYKKATNNAWTRLGGSISSGVTGTLPVANGGTGLSTLTANKIMVGNGTGVVNLPTNLHYDLSTNRLGIGTTSPRGAIDLQTGSMNIAPTQGIALGLSEAIPNGVAGMYHTTGTSVGFLEIYANIGGIYFSTATQRLLHLSSSNLLGVGTGTVAPTEKLHVVGNARITGNVSVGSATPTTSGTGITFPATQSASTNVNTLDDYEEGTFTPSWVSSGATFVYDASYRHGRYTKIGNTVYVSFHISTTEIPGGTITNALTISGMPFVSGNVDNSHFSAFNYGYLYNIDWPANKTQATAIMNRNGSAVAMQWEQDSTASAQWLASALREDSYLIINGFYFVP